MATPIIKVSGIGLQTAKTLSEHGYKSAEDIAVTTEDQLANVPGFGLSRANKVIAAAKNVVSLPAKPATNLEKQKKVKKKKAAKGKSAKKKAKELTQKKKKKGKKAAEKKQPEPEKKKKKKRKDKKRKKK